MKLAEHVDKLRDLIEASFDKNFARLGIGKTNKLEIDRLPDEVKPKRLRFEEMLESHIGETGDYEHAREKLIEELTFTLFNRLAAVKIMEEAALFPPILTKQSEHGDRSFGHTAWLEINPHMRSEELEGIREYLKHAFNELGETLPLYSKAYPYALLPDAISLNEIIDAFNEVEKDSQVGSDIWQSDDVLGWMYEAYNAKRKENIKEDLKIRKIKYEYDRIHIQSCAYTPRWVVRFLVENSLGKLYLEMFPDSEIKHRYKIANAPQTQERTPKSLRDIKVIDPACGSGNFLLYAFDFFFELYLDQIENYGADYDEEDIPKLIIENNLHGIDLDDRAVQLAHLGLFIKAKKKRRSIGELNFKVVSSDFFLPDYEAVEHIFAEGTTLNQDQQELIADIWTDLRYAYKFGSLIKIDERLISRFEDLQKRSEKGELFAWGEKESHENFASIFFTNLHTAVEQHSQIQGSTFLTRKTRDAITFLELLTTEYDVATANPPYTPSADYGIELKAFIGANYKKPLNTYENLYSCFISRCLELTKGDGVVGMITPQTFMFIDGFKHLREIILKEAYIQILVQYGFGGIFKESIDPAFYVLKKGSQDKQSIFLKFDNIFNDSKFELLSEILRSDLRTTSSKYLFRVNQEKFFDIKAQPFIYWISDFMRKTFSEGSLDQYLKVCQGLATCNNNRFLRYHWEVPTSSIGTKWFLYAKGGAFNKWYGNLWLTVNWENDGEEVIEFTNELSKSKPGGRVKNKKYYLKEGITYSASGRGGYAFRHLPKGCIFDVGGSSIFLVDEYKNFKYVLGFLNSKLAFYIADCLNPTANIQVGDIKRVPFKIPDRSKEESISEKTTRNVNIVKYLKSYSILEPDYKQNAFLEFKEASIKKAIERYFSIENHLLTQVLLNEAIINEDIFWVYSLTEHDKEMVLAKEGTSVGCLPVSSEARNAYMTESEAIKKFPIDAILEFVEELPVKEFTVEEREAIENGLGSLYKSNNNLEEYCIRHNVNPINVWYWFKQGNVIPQQRTRTLAMEFLADMIREILMEDEDGIIPLVPNAGEKVLLDRIEEKFREKGFSSAQYSSFDSVLGRPIHEYLNKHLFVELSDHLNLFMYLPKTPFIWHLSSGPEQGFDCYLIIYKWSRDKLMRLRSVYIEHRERSLVNRQSDLAGNESAEAQTEKDRIVKQLKEIEVFKKKIDELLAEGYNPILDDGVGKNIAPLQKKKMIPYEVLNAGQLKKYLNADW